MLSTIRNNQMEKKKLFKNKNAGLPWQYHSLQTTHANGRGSVFEESERGLKFFARAHYYSRTPVLGNPWSAPADCGVFVIAFTTALANNINPCEYSSKQIICHEGPSLTQPRIWTTNIISTAKASDTEERSVVCGYNWTILFVSNARSPSNCGMQEV